MLRGRVKEIIYQNEENGYTVAVIQAEETGETTLTGCLPSVQENDFITVEGQWKVHEIYGRQFQVETFQHSRIDTADAAFAYLSSGAISGIGKKMAERIVRRFGREAVEILEKNPEAYLQVEGIGRKKLQLIVESHNEGRELREVISLLVPCGISPLYCMRIHQRYRENTLVKVRENPYGLCRDIRGIGFKKADELARRLEHGLDSNERVEQGLLYLLQEAATEGHTYLRSEQLISRAKALLLLPEERIRESLADLSVTENLNFEHFGEEERISLLRYSLAETGCAANLIRLASAEKNPLVPSGKEAQALVGRLQKEEKIELSAEQIQAATEALLAKVLILTGGPGTGKTTVLSFILRTMEEIGKKVLLCAPTGRAAKRLSEATGKTAATIHRLLEATVSGEEFMVFQKNEEDPLCTDVLIVDEISMVDTLLMSSLLRALQPGTSLILVGDKDQLPSVGAGKVFQDILDSRTLPVIRLTEIFRQAKESMIVVNAHRIQSAQMPICNEKGRDFFFMERRTQTETASLIVELVSRRLKAYYGFADGEIQVLSPMRKSETGVLRLNELLQEALNPPQTGKREHTQSGRVLRVGDRVMHIRNNYEKVWKNDETGASGEGIFNGDIGYIDFIETAEKKLYLRFDDGKRVEYDFTELDEIEHAFATTVHKSQGSEFPCVVLPVFSMPPMLMNRKILYTAITRAKKIVVLVGQRQYLRDMVENIYEETRNTTLCDKLRLFVESGIILKESGDGDLLPF